MGRQDPCGEGTDFCGIAGRHIREGSRANAFGDE
jgi:hypothetical protein